MVEPAANANSQDYNCASKGTGTDQGASERDKGVTRSLAPVIRTANLSIGHVGADGND